MLIASDYPFLDILWTMIIFFAWVAWIWIVITVLADVFRRHDIGGWAEGRVGCLRDHRAVPGVLIYLIAQHDGMRERSLDQATAQQASMDQYVRDTAGGSATEIAKAKELLDSGAISQQEYDSIKARALS